MKKETVSNDSLKEKIEEILTPYPDPMSRNDFRIACHIGTRTSLYLLQSGLVPCKNNGKKTRCYKIAKKDVAEYLYRRESDPMRYTPPSGWYYNYPKHKKPAASLERKLNYTGEERLLAKEWYEQQLANYPDVLTVAQSLRGDRLPTPHHSEMVQQGLAENHLADTQVYDSQSMAAGICDIRFFQRDQPKMWKTLCRHQGNRWFTQNPIR